MIALLVRARAAFAVTVVGLASAACNEPPDRRAVDAGPPLLSLGTGPDDFVPLFDGGTIPAYMGPQGGFHVYLSVRAANVAPGDTEELPTTCDAAGPHVNPCVDFVVTDAASGDVLDLYVPLRLPLVPLPTGGYELPLSRVVQLDVASLADLDGTTLQVSASLADTDGRVATASLLLTAVASLESAAAP